MSDDITDKALANGQLELACRVGLIPEIDEALAEGADINCFGSSPLFIGIMANDQNVVEALVERGADVSTFSITATDKAEVVAALMALAPQRNDPAGAGDNKVDPKLVRAFDRMIRNKGLGEPIIKNRSAEYTAFAEGLKWIAAEDCHAVVAEFLDMVEFVRSEKGDAGMPEFLEENAARIKILSDRYANLDESPRDLLKDYLKEQKKLAG